MSKQPIRPKWTTTVDPSEYDYVGQFTRMVRLANRDEAFFVEMDVGKVWGLVEAHQRLERENAALRDAIKNIALLTANGDAERANWVALGILNDPHAAIDAARKEAKP